MKLWLLALFPALGWAHMVSMSTGELHLDGARASYELKMPSYEAEHARNPDRAFFEHIHFNGGGGEAKQTSGQCRTDDGTYTCVATYEFPQAPDAIEAECTFAAITVPNHLHVLRAYKDDKTSQVVFDISFTTAELRFRPPTPWEIFVQEAGAGFMRAAGGMAPLLFLISLALAARSGREFLLLAASLLIGETAACLLLPKLGLVLSPRFIEAAAALTIAYLAFEILLLPRSGQRWLVVGVLGLFHGAYFSTVLASTNYGIWRFLAGVATAETMLLAILFFAGYRLGRIVSWRHATPAAAMVLLAAGATWFALRVWA